MKSNAPILIVALLICFLLSNSPLVAQSRDRNNPTQLLSPVIEGFAGADSSVYWYRLTADPGELIFHMRADCFERDCGGISARFVLYDKNMQAVMDESLVADRYGSKSKNHSLSLQSRQDFLLSIGHGSTGGKPGRYRIQFEGAVDLPQKESDEKDD